MTTTQSLLSQGLTAEVAEDQMQIGTSPYIQLDDIDLDLDDNNREHFTEDNSMVDDATENIEFMQQDDATTNQDDLMFDGAADDDLLDFDEEYDYERNPIDHDFQNGKTIVTQDTLALESPQNQQLIAIPDHEAASVAVEDKYQEVEGEEAAEFRDDQADEAEMNEEEEATNTVYISPDTLTDRLPDRPTQPKTAITGPESTNTENVIEPSNLDQSTNQDETFQPDAAQTPRDYSADPDNRPGTEQAYSDHEQTNAEVNDFTIAAHAEDEDTGSTVEATARDENSAIAQQDPVPSHLHPITVTYMDQEYSLFPPEDHDDDTTYLLQDSVLASQPFEKLLAACRELIGEGLGHDDEMVMDIPTLGLHICEDSKYATQISLAQVVDTYMLLSQNEQLSTIEPLRCRLSHRVCLESQVAYLVNSAREGKSYTTIAEEHIGSPEEAQDLGPHGETTKYYDTPDASEDQADEALDETVEIEDSEQDLAYGRKAERVEQNEAEAVDAETLELGDEDEPNAGFETAVAQTSEEVVLPEENSARSDTDADQDDAATSQSSHTVEGDHNASTLHEEVHIPAVATEAQDDPTTTGQEQYNLVDEEDLFAEDQTDAEGPWPADVTDGNHAANDIDHQNGHTSNPEEDELIEWDNDDEQGSESTGAPPATPSKAVNAKRKLEEAEDYFIDLEDTPDAKRTRSS